MKNITNNSYESTFLNRKCIWCIKVMKQFILWYNGSKFLKHILSLRLQRPLSSIFDTWMTGKDSFVLLFSSQKVFQYFIQVEQEKLLFVRFINLTRSFTFEIHNSPLKSTDKSQIFYQFTVFSSFLFACTLSIFWTDSAKKLRPLFKKWNWFESWNLYTL